MRRYAEFARFLAGGAVNTVVTYALYLGLLRLMPYLWAYSLSYVAGIALSLVLNARFVFRSRIGLRSLLLYPFVYVVQYAVGSVCVVYTVRNLGIPAAYAPLIAIAATIPLTFALSRWILRPRVAPAATSATPP